MTTNSPRPASGESAPKVLVIEDEAGLRDMLAYGLPRHGYRVETARDGEQALRMARESDFDLAVCDIMMPGMRGTEVLRRLKALRPDTEVVMATGYATLETAVESMKDGAYDYISKPYALDRLLQTLSQALERRRLKSRIVSLEALDRMKSEFLANMSHELRTPLNAIVGYASLLADGAFGPATAQQVEALERVNSGANDLLTLINGILDLSKLNAGMMPVFPEEFDAAGLAREVVETTRSLAVRKGLALAARAPGPLRLRSDRTKVKQMLINLVGNAIKFTDKGAVTVETARDPATGRTVFTVTDTGPGIAAESLAVVFEEFRQLDGSARREHGGTGLGLAIVKKLGALLGGEVSVTSRPGEGSAFRIELPALGEGAPPAIVSTGAARPATGGRPVVLAIDDDPQVLQLLSLSLKDSGYDFLGAQSAEEGLALARETRPFAITLDIMMPHRDGWSTLQTLKKDPELRAIPVVILSIVENKGLGFSLGAADYVVKPFDRTVLIEKLRALETIRGRRLLVAGADAASRLQLRRALESEGCTVCEASTGKAVVDAVARGPRPDAVFMDLDLPDMSGFEVLRALEGCGAAGDPAVVVVTREGMSDAELEALDRRVALVLTKGSLGIGEIVRELKARLASLRRREEASHA